MSVWSGLNSTDCTSDWLNPLCHAITHMYCNVLYCRILEQRSTSPEKITYWMLTTFWRTVTCITVCSGVIILTYSIKLPFTDLEVYCFTYIGPATNFKDPFLWFKDPFLWFKDHFLWFKNPFLWFKDPFLWFKKFDTLFTTMKSMFILITYLYTCTYSF